MPGIKIEQDATKRMLTIRFRGESDKHNVGVIKVLKTSLESIEKDPQDSTVTLRVAGYAFDMKPADVDDILGVNPGTPAALLSNLETAFLDRL